MRKLLCSLAVALLSHTVIQTQAADVVLTDPTNSIIHATALDQPELFAVLTDNGQTIMNGDQPAFIEAFVDTGASGFVISNLHVDPTYAGEVVQLGLTQADYIGEFTETGVAGDEIGYVTRQLGVRVINKVPELQAVPDDLANGFDAGEQNLWVRKAPGVGEIVDSGLFGMKDPVNIVGMPAIRQRVMVMDVSAMNIDLDDLANIHRLDTSLVTPQQATGIQTNITFDLELHDFVGDATGVLPSHSENPVFKNVTVSHNGTSDSSVSKGWLFDTGSGGTMLSFAKAQAIGLIDPSYATLDEFLADHTAAGGMTSQVGGIGTEIVTVPLLQLDELRIPSKEGFDVVWKNVMVSVLDVAGLDGVFGMNMLVPSVTIDAAALGDPESMTSPQASDAFAALLAALGDTSPRYFDTVIFDASNPDNVQLRMYSQYAPVPEPMTLSIMTIAGLAVLRKRRRHIS